MKAIIVDDEYLMIQAFMRLSRGIEDLDVIGKFEFAEEAVQFAENNRFEIAFLDIELPGMNGLECARKLREIMPGILIVFISAYDSYLRESNLLGGDDYLVKPYKSETLQNTMEKMRLLVKRQEKRIYVQMFGRFTIKKDGVPVPLSGKAKEILAMILVRRGKEISNEEIYSTIWESRAYSNVHMKVYYNALKRLRNALEKNGLSDLIFSTARGQIANVDLFDCDYYEWRDCKDREKTRFEGEFLSEYSWGEYILGEIINEYL